MTHEQNRPTPDELGLQPDALSNEVLKLKIDDLFQEIESLKTRVARLEGGSQGKEESGPPGAESKGVVSDPDHPKKA